MAKSGLSINLKGMERADWQMKRIERGLEALKDYDAIIYSKLPYAHGIETGRHPRGSLARKVGGARYLRRAAEQVLAGADRDLSEGLDRVTAPGVWVVRRLGLWARRLARENAPRGPRGFKRKSHKHRLYRSIQYDVRKQS